MAGTKNVIKVKHSYYEELTQEVHNLNVLLEVALKLEHLGYDIDDINDRLNLGMPKIGA